MNYGRKKQEIKYGPEGISDGLDFCSSYLVCIACIFFLLSPAFTSAQNARTIPTQQLRGVILDQVLQTPIEGATVSLSGLNRSVTSDNKGMFRFSEVPIGVHQLVISNVGYKEAVLDNITIISGKEKVLNISLENRIQTAEAIVVKANSRKNKPLNDMSMVSARAFTVEETQKYAAAVNDPLRMATGFPGVVTTDDGNNNIIIRGNSPTGLLWRMEGVDIPNPNHFSSTGSSGGGISLLSAQLLSNSDFITGAFAAEYGNALSGVFDLKLRKGNNEKKEYTVEAGLLGLNAAAEGPLGKNGASYLVNYRYSTLSLLGKLGVPLSSGTTNFQDLAYNVYLPTKKVGVFTLFGFGGLSSDNQDAERDSTKWTDKWERYDSKYVSNTAATGITHSILVGAKTNLRSAIALSYNKIAEEDWYVEDNYQLREDYKDDYRTKKLSLSSTLNQKFSTKSSLRAGAIVTLIGFDYFKKTKDNDTAPLKEVINTKDHTQTLQGFAQWQYKPADRLTFNIGLHYLQLIYNNSHSLEPRASLKWQANKSNSLAFGYGGHSQLQALGVYFAEHTTSNGKTFYPNHDLGLTKAHHYIFSYQHSFNKNLSLKTEIYYQQLYNVPVGVADSGTFSVLNIEREYVTDPLVNKGKGKNYGIEISLERYLANYFYYTVSASFYQSKYTALDMIERNTRFNGNYLSNMVAGKEFLSANKLRTFGINVKMIYSGGLRSTPIDEARSHFEGQTVYDHSKAFSLRNPDYFRTDVRVSMKWNKRKALTSTLSLDIQNVSNRLNVYGQWYDSQQGKVATVYQNGLIPVLNYKVEF